MSETVIDSLAFKGKYTEDTIGHTRKRFLANESLKWFNAEGNSGRANDPSEMMRGAIEQ